MSLQHQALRAYTEADVQIAISDITRNQIQSIQRAEKVYNVPKQTIQRRRDRTHCQRDCEPNRKHLTKLEEEVVVQRILEESERGIPSSKADVRVMADKLLRDRGGDAVGKNWVDRFIQRTPKLQTRWSRPYKHQRAACKDPAVIQPWFTLVQLIKVKYSIVDEYMYNFDKSSFLIGRISS
jgi:hypothetical protein